MTATARNLTDGDDVRVRMRTGSEAVVRPIRPDIDPGTGRAHAIPRSPAVDQAQQVSKVRNFVSQHVGEVAADLKQSQAATELPATLTELLDDTIPGWAQANRNPARWIGLLAARLWRLAITALAYQTAAAVRTDLRAGISLLLTIAVFLTALAITLTH